MKSDPEGCEGFIPAMLIGCKVRILDDPRIVTVVSVEPTHDCGIPGWEAFVRYRYFIDARSRHLRPHKTRTEVRLWEPLCKVPLSYLTLENS